MVDFSERMSQNTQEVNGHRPRERTNTISGDTMYKCSRCGRSATIKQRFEQMQPCAELRD